MYLKDTVCSCRGHMFSCSLKSPCDTTACVPVKTQGSVW